MDKYDFRTVGEQITKTLVEAAENQVTEAQNLLDSTKVLAEGIEVQLEEQSKLLNDMNNRLKVFGESILEAHKKYLNVPMGKTEAN